MSRPPVRTSDALLSAHERRISLLERRILTSPSGLPDRLLADSTDLGTADLNDVITSGWYVQSANVQALPERHYPDKRAGFLEVIGSTAGSGFVAQRYTDFQATLYDDRNVWLRTSYGGSWYPWRRMDTGQASGPAVRKWSNPVYWDMYYETDNNRMMVGNNSGGWRQYSGSLYDSEKSWATTANGGGGAYLAGRTIYFTVPTVLESYETLQVTMDPAQYVSGFDFIGVAGLDRNSTNTTITVRYMQLMSLATQPLRIIWQIVPT